MKNIQIKNQYDQTAEHYSVRYEIPQYLKYSIVFSRFFEFFCHKSQKKNNIHTFGADIGSGTGLLSEYLGDLYDIYRMLKDYHSTNIEPYKGMTVSDFKHFLEKASFDGYSPRKLLILLFFYMDLIRGKTPISTYDEFFNMIQTPFISVPIVCCDISFKMLQRSIQEVDKHSKSSFIFDSFPIACDAEKLPFRDELFPIIFSFTVIQNCENPNGAISEIIRILQPKGIFAGSSLKKKNTFSESKFSECLLGNDIENLKSSYNSPNRQISSGNYFKIDVTEDKIASFQFLQNLLNDSGLIDNFNLKRMLYNVEDYLFIFERK